MYGFAVRGRGRCAAALLMVAARTLNSCVRQHVRNTYGRNSEKCVGGNIANHYPTLREKTAELDIARVAVKSDDIISHIFGVQ